MSSLLAEPPTICVFALLTGQACPGCGMTRAVLSLVQAEWATAWAFHPLVYLLVPGVVIGLIWFIGRRRFGWQPLVSLERLAIPGVAMALVVWGVRWSAGTLPPV